MAAIGKDEVKLKLACLQSRVGFAVFPQDDEPSAESNDTILPSPSRVQLNNPGVLELSKCSASLHAPSTLFSQFLFAVQLEPPKKCVSYFAMHSKSPSIAVVVGVVVTELVTDVVGDVVAVVVVVGVVVVEVEGDVDTVVVALEVAVDVGDVVRLEVTAEDGVDEGAVVVVGEVEGDVVGVVPSQLPKLALCSKRFRHPVLPRLQAHRNSIRPRTTAQGCTPACLHRRLGLCILQSRS